MSGSNQLRSALDRATTERNTAGGSFARFASSVDLTRSGPGGSCGAISIVPCGMSPGRRSSSSGSGILPEWTSDAAPREAVARQAEIVKGVREGTHTARSKSLTVAEAGSVWLDAAQADGLERATVAGYRQHLEAHLVPFIGDVKLADLTVASIAVLQDRLRTAGRSASLVRKVRTSLGQLLSAALERGLVTRNIVRELPKKKRKRAEQKPKLKAGIDIPLPHEINAILSHAGRWRPLLLVAAFTGLRASELRPPLAGYRPRGAGAACPAACRLLQRDRQAEIRDQRAHGPVRQDGAAYAEGVAPGLPAWRPGVPERQGQR